MFAPTSLLTLFWLFACLLLTCFISTIHPYNRYIVRGTVSGDVTEVPGIGPAAAKKLACGEGDEKVTNTYQLIGKFLMLKGPDDAENKVESMEHCEKFWYWLQDKGISAHRSAIVKAVACKVNGLFPGVYDPDLYDDDDE